MSTYKKLTYKDLDKFIKELLEEKPELKMDWCKPVAPGLYKTGDVYHGEGMIKELQRSMEEEHKKQR
jgi:hypothetical protein